MCPFEPGKPVVASAMHAIPTVVWLRPVNSDARVGEQIAVVWNCVYFRPPSASRCMVGISIGPPNGDNAPKPVSSQTMNNTFGAPSGAFGCAYGSQSGVESRTSRLIMPLNGLLMMLSLPSRALTVPR